MHPSTSLDDIRWLVGNEARSVLAELSDREGSLVAMTAALQRRFSAARAHLLLEQVELRRRGAAKFPSAERMFFSAQALEQATDIHVARYKAQRFPAAEPLADLCCGIGGDLLALATRAPVTAVDCSEAALVLARANLDAVGEAEPLRCKFVAADVEQFSVEPYTAWHLDPDRRAGGRRTTQLASYAPGTETIERLRGECRNGAVKLAPATEVPPSWQRQAELEWIGRNRQCRQQVAWFGNLAEAPGLRRATALRTGEEGFCTATSFVGEPGIDPPVAGQVGRFVFEPDPAVLAADLGGVLARHHGLGAIHPAVPYFTGDTDLDEPLLQRFEVDEVLPFDRKRLRAIFRARGVGRLEIKIRGLDERPERIRRDLQLRGDDEAVLLLARLGRRVTAIVARRA